MRWPVIISGVILLILVGGGLFMAKHRSSAPPPTPVATSAPTETKPETKPIETTTPTPTPAWQWPMDRVNERVTKIKFGLFVTPTNSPIQPQRFTGYHTGWDFEVFPEELTAEVPVTAFCTGPIALKKTADGYGGVVVQRCTLDNQAVTVIYGHVALKSVSAAIGQEVKVGEKIGQLGAERSSDTDGERKHLHFDIHKGSAINIRGYVPSQSQLSGWIDPSSYL